MSQLALRACWIVLCSLQLAPGAQNVGHAAHLDLRKAAGIFIDLKTLSQDEVNFSGRSFLCRRGRDVTGSVAGRSLASKPFSHEMEGDQRATRRQLSRRPPCSAAAEHAHLPDTLACVQALGSSLSPSVAGVLCLNTACAAVLDAAQEGALRHVVAHLGPYQTAQLRQTCRALRHHADILTAISCVRGDGVVPGSEVDVSYLLRLTGLTQLKLSNPASLADLPRLSQLRVAKLVVTDAAVALDLYLLRYLPSLHSLRLEDVNLHVNVEHLASSLSKLSLHGGVTASSELSLLVGLRVLLLSEASQTSCLSALTQLTRMRFVNSHPFHTHEVCEMLRQLPSVRALTLHAPVSPPDLLTLTQLQCLCLSCIFATSFNVLQDLSSLSRLSRLGLYYLKPGQARALASPTLTSLFLHTSSVEGQSADSLPSLQALPSLSLLQLWLDGEGALLGAAGLPARRIRVESCMRHCQAALYLDTAANVHHVAVSRLTFGHGAA